MSEASESVKEIETLDEQVHRLLDKGCWHEGILAFCDVCGSTDINPAYTTKLDFAWQCVEFWKTFGTCKNDIKTGVNLYCEFGLMDVISFWKSDSGKSVDSIEKANTLPGDSVKFLATAICRAFVKIMGEEPADE